MKQRYNISIILWIIWSIILIFSIFQWNNISSKDIILVEISPSQDLVSYQGNPEGIFWYTPAGKWYGTLISDRYILTAGHVVSNPRISYNITGLWEITVTANNIYFDEQLDMAVLHLSDAVAQEIDVVFASEYPQLWDKVISLWVWEKHWIITNISENTLTHTIPFSPGESGSVLLNKKNEILAINIASSQSEDIWYSVLIEPTSLSKFLQ